MATTGELLSVDMSNGSISGVPLVKIPFGNRPSVTEMLFNGVATTPRSNVPGIQATSAYSGIELPGLVRRMQAAWRYPPGGPNSCVVLISNPNGLTDVGQITARSVHTVITPVGIQAAYYDDSGYHNLPSQIVSWDAPLAQDDLTIHNATIDIFRDGLCVFGPDGRTREIEVPGIGRCGGRNFQFQAYAYQQTDTPPIYTGVAVGW